MLTANIYAEYYKTNYSLFSEMKLLKANLKESLGAECEKYINEFFRKLIVAENVFILHTTEETCKVFLRTYGTRILEQPIEKTIRRELLYDAIQGGQPFETKKLGSEIRNIFKIELDVPRVRSILCIPIQLNKQLKKTSLLICFINKFQLKIHYKGANHSLFDNTGVFKSGETTIVEKICYNDTGTVMLMQNYFSLIDRLIFRISDRVLFCNWNTEYILELLCVQLKNLIPLSICNLLIKENVANRIIYRLSAKNKKIYRFFPLNSIIFIKDNEIVSSFISFSEDFSQIASSSRLNNNLQSNVSKSYFTLPVNNEDGLVVGELKIEKEGSAEFTALEYKVLEVHTLIIESVI